MNLHSRKARIPIAALGVAALCTTGMGVLATSASAAPTPLDLNSGGTSPVVGNFGHATDNAAATAYALKILGSDQDTNRVLLESSPTAAATLSYANITANGPALAASTWVPLDRDPATVTPTNVSASATGAAVPNSNNLYVQGDVPGTYTFRVFQDTNDSDTYDAADERSTALITLTVKDVNGATASSADDLDYSVTATNPIDAGERSTAKVTVQDLSKTDARGSTIVGGASVGILGNELTDLITGTWSNLGLPTGATALAFDGSTYNSTSGPASAGNTGQFSAAIGTLSRNASVVVADNTVTGLTNTNVDTANVDYPANAGAAKVRTGTGAVTYTVKATKNAGADAVNNASVFFRVLPAAGGSPAIAAADLTTSAGVPDADGDVLVKSGTDGTASLTVTSSKTANANAYTVAARSNGQAAGTITSTYATPATAAVKSGGNVTAKVGTSVQLTGTVLDQWGQAFYPGAGVTAALTYTNVGAGTPTPTSGNYAIGSDGKFGVTVSEAANNTTPSTDTYRWNVSGTLSDTGTRDVNWVASITPGTVTLADITTANGGGATVIPFTNPATTVDLATSGTFAGDVETLRGLVRDDSQAAGTLAYATVNYSGSDGVWFYDADNKLVKTLTARANASGQLSYDESADGVRVLFTKTGPATVTVKAGSATDTANVPVEASTTAYKVIAQDAEGEPGSTITLLGKVTDPFGNPATNRPVTLTLDTVSAGTFSGTDADNGTAGFQVNTDNLGVWSTPFTSTSNQNGEATITATLTGFSQNPVMNAAWTAAGVTIDHGEYQDTASIKVDEAKLTISTTGALVGGGKAKVSGTAPAGRSIKVFVKPAGATGYSLGTTVTADAQGEWGVGATIKKSTSFYAESGSLVSPVVGTTVYSFQTVKAKALGKGKVQFQIFGVPNTKGTATVWYGSKKLGSKTTNSAGDATLTVQSSKGKKSFKIYFAAPGTSLKGTILTGTVK